MSKKRLEEAKLMAKMLRVETRLPHDFPFDLVDWLVEQAERVQELESNSYNAHLERLLDRKEQEIERYREALEEIAQKRMTYADMAEVLMIARKALEGDK